MKPGWGLVIIVGFLAAVARLAAPAALADLAAIGYLLTATVMFDRGRRITSGRIHVPASSRD
jgi:hypothetical protein